MHRRLGVLTGSLGLLVCCIVAACADTTLDRLDVTRGYCAVVGSRAGGVAVELAQASELTVYAQLPNAKSAQSAARAADAAGLYGTRVFIGQGDGSAIGLADNIADAMVVAGNVPSLDRAEVLRVLRPRGKALIGDEELVKPVPEGVDDWSHHYHGPDNNTMSQDTLARAPYLTQFIAEPRYGPAPQATVASAGRVFTAFGHVAWHEREEPIIDTLLAMDGYNGTVLWKRPLTSGIMVDRSTMIATPETLYLADETSCKLLDAATGEVKDEITLPANEADGPFWKWMALQDGVLYAMVGKEEKLDQVAQWKARRHGWPWGGISDGYNANRYTWGLGKTLFAIDPETKRVLWSHRQDAPFDSRALCMKGDRIYLVSFGEFIACLNAKTGTEVWRRSKQSDPQVFEAIGPYRPGHGYVGGWKSTVYMKCTDDMLYIVGPQVEWLTALSAEDGSVSWKFPVKDLHIVVRDDGVYTIGAQGSQGHTKKLDAETGAILAEYQTHRRACTRSVGVADGIFFRASGGSVRLDLPSGKPQWISPMRPSCHIGVVVANGHLYWQPWTCDCNLQMFGSIALGPAADLDLTADTTTEDRLEKLGSASVADFPVASADWPTYRADNLRKARSRAAIPESPALLWSIQPTETTLTAPVAAGGSVFVAAEDGIVRCLDAATGKRRWQAYTGGAVRFPPTIADGRALVGSGDGWAYALEAATGRGLWRFRAAPAERRIPVYGSLLSTWPVGCPVLVDEGTAYLAAGITDYDGTHVFALDAATGDIKWQNNTAGHLDEFSRRGVACQGETLLNQGVLFLAGGNATSPGTFDAATGKCFNRAPDFVGTRHPRGRELHVDGRGVKVSGQPLYSTPEAPVFDGSAQWVPAVVTTRNAELTFEEEESGGEKTWKLVARSRDGGELWREPLTAQPVRWGIAVDAEGRIIITLTDGRILCLG